MSEGIYLSGWRYRAVVLSIVASALGYLGFSLWGGWEAVVNAVAQVGLMGVTLALSMSSLNYAIRFLRWQIYLKALGHPVPWRPSLKIYLSGFALTTTPGKAGEAMRGVLLKPLGVPYAKSFAAFFSERLNDLFAVVLLALFGLTLYPQALPLVIAGVVLVGVVFTGLSQRKLIVYMTQKLPREGGNLKAMARHLLNVLLEAQLCHRPLTLLIATLLTVMAWGAEAFAFYWILNAMGAEIPLTFAIFVYSVSMLAGALSFMPGGLGGAEAVMVALLVWKGMPGSDAVAATVLIRLATLWFAVGVGALFLTTRNRTELPTQKT